MSRSLEGIAVALPRCSESTCECIAGWCVFSILTVWLLVVIAKLRNVGQGEYSRCLQSWILFKESAKSNDLDPIFKRERQIRGA